MVIDQPSARTAHRDVFESTYPSYDVNGRRQARLSVPRIQSEMTVVMPDQKGGSIKSQ